MGVDVVLVSPPSRANSSRPPMGLMSIAAYLERAGISCEIIDLKVSPYESVGPKRVKAFSDEIIAKLKVLRPTLVGLPCLTPEYEEVITLSSLIKEAIQAKVVVGGTHPTVCPQDFIGTSVDYVVLGEGEQTMLDLTKTVIGNRGRIEEVDGLAWFNGGDMVLNRPRHLITNLDELPFPAYDKVDMEYYTKPYLFTIRMMLLSGWYIFTGRGCPFGCTFCANRHRGSIWSRHPSAKPIRLRSVKNVVDEIELLSKKYKIDGFFVFDDTFTITERRVLDFCQELGKRNLDLIWGCETRVNLVNEKMLDAMKRAGCVQIEFGVESGSQRVLNELKKGITVEQSRKVFSACRSRRVRTLANFMFNTPGETEEEVKQTLTLARELKANSYVFSIMTPYPGTDIFSPDLKIKPSEYHLLGQARSRLMHPSLRFAKHNMDLEKLARTANASLARRLWYYFSFLLCRPYWRRLLKSSRKLQYILGLLSSFRSLFIPGAFARIRAATRPSRHRTPTAHESKKAV